ncbi:SH2 domain-containing protein 3C-like [Candoia aspera]|uniref:SH2 domain-containing protein 3C-like n=1 Tax=Candoia aspera TaxID=51853 RepID=UPI002FD7DDBB
MAESQKKGGGFKKFFKLKGFGSLSSIPRSFAFRRVSVAPRLAETGGELLSPNGFLTLSFESTQDDLGAGPKSPSRYARSCNMFSHMGTMPRGSSRQKVGAQGPDKALEPTLPSAPSQTGSPPPGEGPEQKEKGSINVGPSCSQKVTLQAENSSKCFLEPGEISSLGTKEKPKQIEWDDLQRTSGPLERAPEDLKGIPSGPSHYAQSCNAYSHLGTMPRARTGQSKKPIQEMPKKTQQDLAQDLPAKAILSCAETAEKTSEEHLEQG